MSSIKTAAVIAALAMTVSVYGSDGSAATMSAGRDVYRPFLCEAIDQSSLRADVVRPEENRDFTKPVPMWGYCFDSDGGDNPAVAGYLIDTVETLWHDQCQNSTRLIENFCGSNGGRYYVTHDCTCVSEWISTPAGNRYAGKCQ